MTATRSRKEEKMYGEHRRQHHSKQCPFCAVKSSDSQFVQETDSFKVIKNIFPYSLWDGQRVVDHLMITPVAHTDSLGDMTAEQKVQYVDLIEAYERKGYNIYARAPGSLVKSVVHQHTHLIKTVGKTKRFVFLLRRPYIRFVR